MNGLLLIAALVVGTWNGNWFPSGRAEHRAHPAVEEATITAAANMLADGLRRIDPAGTNDVILCLHEMRGPTAASNLIARIGRRDLRLAVISGYRRRDRFDMQQDAIATTLPLDETRWALWPRPRHLIPPRGYAFAAVRVASNVTVNVYAVHLKSNYGATRPELVVGNRDKRTAAIEHLVMLEQPQDGRGRCPVIIAGDMNTDNARKAFQDEPLFGILSAAGFADPLSGLPPARRCTYPSKRYGDSAFDRVFCRGLRSVAEPQIIPSEGLSDHRALFVLLDFPSSP